MATQNNNAVVVDVHGPVRPWVYKRLVEDDGDFVGLIAYGLYKKRKTELAESHRKNGITEDVIFFKLKEYHDQVVVGDSEIDRFRSDATLLLNDLFHNVTSSMRGGHEQDLKALKVDKDTTLKAMQENHEKAIKAARVFHEKAIKDTKKHTVDEMSNWMKQAKQKLRARDKCVSWLLDGVQNTLAGVVVTIFVFGSFTAFTSDSIKIAIATKAVQVLTGSEPTKTSSTPSSN